MLQFQWRYAEGGVFKNYPPTTNCQLEIAYQDKKDGFQWKDEDTGDVFLVLFDSMIERSTTRHSAVDVERCVIGGKCYVIVYLIRYKHKTYFQMGYLELFSTNVGTS